MARILGIGGELPEVVISAPRIKKTGIGDYIPIIIGAGLGVGSLYVDGSLKWALRAAAATPFIFTAMSKKKDPNSDAPQAQNAPNQPVFTIPKNRPDLSVTDFQRYTKNRSIDRKKHPIVLVAIRNYYADVMGEDNDRNFYNDALMLHIQQPDGTSLFRTFNYNTDPSKFKPGIATLEKGLYFVHKLDFHKQKYLAICQRAGFVTVKRDGKSGTDSGPFGINIHSGGLLNTFSEGCQTLPEYQFKELMTLVLDYFDVSYSALFANGIKPSAKEKADYTAKHAAKLGKLVIPYLLT